MVGLRMLALSLIAFVLVVTATIACDSCGGYVSPASYVAPAYLNIPCPTPPSAMCPCMPGARYATPTPAPASPGPGVLSTHEPPVGPPSPPPYGKAGKGPTIFQNRTFSGVPQITEPRSQLCKVSFWNLSGLDVNLSVGERIVPVAKDRAVILDLDRNFAWRTNYHNAKTEEVPDDLNHFEVMIR